MRELRRQNFRGLVAVEYEKEGPVEDDLRQEVAFARKLAKRGISIRIVPELFAQVFSPTITQNRDNRALASFRSEFAGDA